MLFEKTDVIDFISIEDDLVWLTIADEMDWHDPDDHLTLLQDKINTYLTFIENGYCYTSNLKKLLHFLIPPIDNFESVAFFIRF